MDWTDVGAALAGVAPALANALLPGIGGPAVTLIEKALGVAPGAFAGNPAAAAQAIQAATPEQIVALQHAQNELPLATMANQLETLRVELADVQSARARDLALSQAGKRDARADLMVIGVAVGLVACLAVVALFRDNIPGEVVGIVSTIAGIFGSCLKDAFTFEFGSSRGSQAKDATIASMTLSPTLPPLPPGAKVIDGMPWLAK